MYRINRQKWLTRPSETVTRNIHAAWISLPDGKECSRSPDTPSTGGHRRAGPHILDTGNLHRRCGVLRLRVSKLLSLPGVFPYMALALPFMENREYYLTGADLYTILVMQRKS